MTQQVQIETVLMGFAALKKDLDYIKERLDGKTAVLSTEEAVAGFRMFMEKNRTPNSCRSYRRLLKDFEEVYSYRNIPDISASELEDFLRERWKKANPSTLRQNLVLIQRFFGWCSEFCQYNGQPSFLNPCQFISVESAVPVKQPDFIPVDRMKGFLATAKKRHHWLAFAILMTTGMRVSELIGDVRGGKIGITRDDVCNRVLTIKDPKSGRDREYAVIPQWVSDVLEVHIQDHGPHRRIIEMSHSTLLGVMKSHSKKVGLDLKPHCLRKWCASFWSRQNEYAMANFVLRHSETKAMGATLVSSLGARYIAPPSPQEVIERQDRMMIPELFGKISAC